MPAEKRKTKMGTKWRYRGQYRGVLYHSQLIYSTKQEADRAERLKRIEIDEQVKNPNKVNLHDLMVERLDLLALKKSRKYYLDNRYYYQRLIKYLGNGDIAEITRKQINCFINDFAKDLAERGKGNYRVNNCITCLKALFNYGIMIYELDIKNPVCGIEKFAEEVKIKYIPTDEDLYQVLGLCDSDERLLVRFVMDTGARINEALALTPKNIYDGYVVLYTRKSRYSNLIPRKVPCNTDVLNGFNEFGKWTAQPRFLEKYVKKCCKNKWGWHNLRHRFASKLSKEGRPLYEIMALLGHSNLSTTQKYLQLLP